MGMCLRANNSSIEFDMGAIGFFSLRRNIAMCLDQEFGENYEKIALCNTKEEFAINDKKAEEIVSRKNLDGDIIDFLYQTDLEGKVSHKTCKKIYDLIKDKNFSNTGFRYLAARHNDYEEFKEFLLECYSHRRKMFWS